MHKVWLSIGFAALVIHVQSATAAAPAAARPGWTVTQSGSLPIGGAAIITFSSAGVSISNRDSGLHLVAKSPNWDITLFSTKTKACYKSSLKDWAQSIRKRTKDSGGGPFDGATWKPAKGNYSVAGFPAQTFVTETSGIKKMSCSRSATPSGKGTAKLPSARLYLAKDIVTPAQVSEIVSQLYAVPNNQRLPLKLEFTLPERKPVTRVNTTLIEKQNIPESTFAIPSGLRQVKSDMEVLIDRKIQDEIDQDLQGL